MKVSVVIPCFNHGQYIQEALQSVECNVGNIPYEIIIVDDGSTDAHTLMVMDVLEQGGYTVIRQTNQGLAAARNVGISLARGKYIIPLDSDNKLHSNYLTKAVQLLDDNHEVEVVYGKPMFFGEETGLREVGEYDFFKIIQCNYIDACALFRREVWQKVGGYDGAMPAMGNEDWEFWIHSFLLGTKFMYLNEICFYYRVSPNSMSVSVTRPGFEQNKTYIYTKHGSALIKRLLDELHTLDYIRKNKFRTVAKIILGVNL
ncbi:glycosyltransferase family 2 protein [Hymenobacter mucosus]|uniref:Glycosyltransferase involved in cell wall bisynthesis n=1 Tax=Hymenobacter mucosus TaxID=1411120 RepID=A0A238YFN1_9BACT|nr:glycosyltransferase family A protein [Hymenobacter mucosus]SNR69947.1 Glycosyltransferase involved in cell wall bisynthesis [Hymenobacter mucosus]